MLQEVPGVRVVGTTVIIQGSKDLFGDVPPLFVVDGVYVEDLSDVPPTQVESITVLKGSSAAIYGSRGYGGVIVIKKKPIKFDK
jgi:TonB-dependent starch-binding outer membrane protein SusC